MRKSFYEELDDLHKEVLVMGRAVEENVARAVESLLDRNSSLADQVIESDKKIDRMDRKIEQGCMVLLARQQPVAVDLRMINTILRMILHLERMGDLAVNIAQIAKELTFDPYPSRIIDLFQEMAELVQDLVGRSLKAFADEDRRLALSLNDLDKPIDELYHQLIREFGQLHGDEELMNWATTMVLASRYLERIADHAVSIGERVAYLVTGNYADLHIVD